MAVRGQYPGSIVLTGLAGRGRGRGLGGFAVGAEVGMGAGAMAVGAGAGAAGTGGAIVAGGWGSGAGVVVEGGAGVVVEGGAGVVVEGGAGVVVAPDGAVAELALVGCGEAGVRASHQMASIRSIPPVASATHAPRRDSIGRAVEPVWKAGDERWVARAGGAAGPSKGAARAAAGVPSGVVRVGSMLPASGIGRVPEAVAARGAALRWMAGEASSATAS